MSQQIGRARNASRRLRERTGRVQRSVVRAGRRANRMDLWLSGRGTCKCWVPECRCVRIACGVSRSPYLTTSQYMSQRAHE